MNRIVELKVLNDYLIWMKFNDGTSKAIDFEQFIGEGISKDLSDKNYFKQVTIESGGGLEWPNGFDFCPNYLKDFVQADDAKMA